MARISISIIYISNVIFFLSYNLFVCSRNYIHRRTGRGGGRDSGGGGGISLDGGGEASNADGVAKVVEIRLQRMITNKTTIETLRPIFYFTLFFFLVIDE